MLVINASPCIICSITRPVGFWGFHSTSAEGSADLQQTDLDDANLVCYIQRIVVCCEPDIRLLGTIGPADTNSALARSPEAQNMSTEAPTQ